MILHINNSEYDYHTLVKVAEMAGLAGIVGFQIRGRLYCQLSGYRKHAGAY